jgi:hypothetical protein
VWICGFVDSDSTVESPREDVKSYTKAWTLFGFTNSCVVLETGCHQKSSRHEFVRILQREKKTFLTVIHLIVMELLYAIPTPPE